MKNLFKTFACLWACVATSVMAAEAEGLIEQNLKKVDARIVVKEIGDAPLTGLREVELNSGEVLYADDKGEYFLIGKLYRFTDKEGFVDLTERKKSAQRKVQMADLDEEQLVVYKPKGEVKATVNIFTDVDCPYCRKLHAEIPALNEQGVQVNYLAYPRNGTGTGTFKSMVSIWCAEGAEGRRQAMDQAKSGIRPAVKTCDNPVLDQLQLGQSVGVTGTPAIIFEDGRLYPGYAPAQQLVNLLDLEK
ncbi:DsbC family protein [Neptuniibacter sp. QD34_54]|uniref:DsbC family protein n=1 Tax=Neptuniibacter sp. QD34_54 TaxID=3398208 RepID=UPI0039F533BA